MSVFSSDSFATGAFAPAAFDVQDTPQGAPVLTDVVISGVTSSTVTVSVTTTGGDGILYVLLSTSNVPPSTPDELKNAPTASQGILSTGTKVFPAIGALNSGVAYYAHLTHESDTEGFSLIATSPAFITTDQTVDLFEFTPVFEAQLNTFYESNPVILSGFNATLQAIIANGEHRVNGGSYTSNALNVENNDSYQARGQSSGSFQDNVVTTATIGGVSTEFLISTFSEDLVPDLFSFLPQVELPISTFQVISNTVIISGINASVNVVLSGDPSTEYSKNGGAFSNVDTVAVNGDTFVLRLNASNNSLTQTSGSLTAGGVTGVFTLTTTSALDNIPTDKIVLNEVESGFETVPLLNENFQKIEDEFNEKALYRHNPDDKANFMLNDFDMNDNRILNLPNARSEREPVTLAQAAILVGGSVPTTLSANGVAVWVRAPSAGPWSPLQNFQDITVDICRGNAVVGSHTVRVVLDVNSGNLSVASSSIIGVASTLDVKNNNTPSPTIQVMDVESGSKYNIVSFSVQGGQDGAGDDGVDGQDGVAPEFHYIKPINGTAIKNGSGSITIEAHAIINGVDTVLSTGDTQLYVGTVPVTQANGYAIGSNGYTGVFDAGDIQDSVVVELKDGPSGTVLDTITLIDVEDGIASNATVGSVVPSDGLSWNRAANGGAWTPAAAFTDLVATFYQGGGPVATETRRVTLNTSTGILTSSLEGADASDIDITISNDSTSSITIVFTHVPTGVSIAETVLAVQGGTEGTNGLNGINGQSATFYQIRATNGTALKNSTGTLTIEARLVTGSGNALLDAGTVKLYVGSNEVTVANGYATGSTGYIGVLDSGDISNSVTVELKDGPSGDALDAITLVDVLDGVGTDAVVGSVTSTNGLSYVQAINSGAWSPTGASTDLRAEFYQGGSTAADETQRVTLNQTSGVLTAAIQGSNDPDISVVVTGSGSSALTIEFTHIPSGTIVSERVVAVRSGSDGAAGTPGEAGAPGTPGDNGTGVFLEQQLENLTFTGSASITHASSGAPVQLSVNIPLFGIASSNAFSEGTIRVTRNGTEIGSETYPLQFSSEPPLGNFWSGRGVGVGFLDIIDTPGVGTYTYAVTWSAGSNYRVSTTGSTFKVKEESNV